MFKLIPINLCNSLKSYTYTKKKIVPRFEFIYSSGICVRNYGTKNKSDILLSSVSLPQLSVVPDSKNSSQPVSFSPLQELLKEAQEVICRKTVNQTTSQFKSKTKLTSRPVCAHLRSLRHHNMSVSTHFNYTPQLLYDSRFLYNYFPKDTVDTDLQICLVKRGAFFFKKPQ